LQNIHKIAIIRLDKLELDEDMILLKLENAELKHIERIVAISKAAFDSDLNVGASEAGGPPNYDSIAWHLQMKDEGHLLQVVIDEEIVGGAILFLDKDGETLYIGRIFIDPAHHRKGYGLSLMKMAETYYSGIKKIKLDTPLRNVRTNAFYKKLGYREVKRDEEFAYYQKECD
jgi:ribosomal protein S18 acetylase RimI-like enzyme